VDQGQLGRPPTSGMAEAGSRQWRRLKTASPFWRCQRGSSSRRMPRRLSPSLVAKGSRGPPRSYARKALRPWQVDHVRRGHTGSSPAAGASRRFSCPVPIVARVSRHGGRLTQGSGQGLHLSAPAVGSERGAAPHLLIEVTRLDL